MTGVSDNSTIATYSAQAEALGQAYEAVDPEPFRSTFADLLPNGCGGTDRLALDIGAGSGRDAAWLAGLGFEVVAVEPAEGFRTVGQRLHGAAPIRWLDDRLPALLATHALGLSFDLILMSAVWQHVAPGDRARAFRKVATLLKPRGLLVISLRLGPAPRDRPMHAVSVGELEALAREHGLAVSRVTAPISDGMGRDGVSWVTVCLTLPDDGAGALPLLRGIILNDAKTSTYKLGLLRAVARLADLAPAVAQTSPTADEVVLPLGAVALNWLRLYLPLVQLKLPQAPRNAGPNGLGFAGPGFRALLANGMAAADLRLGAAFTGERAQMLRQALREAARTIAAMPAHFTTYPNSDRQVFVATTGARTGRISPATPLALDAATLSAFGSLVVPGHVWRAMQRLGAWIEPVLTAEWARLTRTYAERQGNALPPGHVEAALAWVEPTRDVGLARRLALERLAGGDTLACVWSGQRLRPTTLDIDHCLPWSAWACGDLWNLLPAHRRVNQHEKRDRLPSAAAMASARDAVIGWWQESWEHHPGHAERFRREAASALAVPPAADLTAMFEALEWRRLRLRQDQQVAEWAGAAAVGRA